MSVKNLLFGSSAESGVTTRLNKDFKLTLKRIRQTDGQIHYLLENKSKNQRIAIPRELMDRFRYTITTLKKDEIQEDFDLKIYYKDREVYRLRPAVGEKNKLVIQDISSRSDSPHFLTLPIDALEDFAKMLYDPEIKHTSELFERLVRYHQLFHFSFAEGSESITSNLVIRRDILCQIDDYIPVVRAGEAQTRPELSPDNSEALEREAPRVRPSAQDRGVSSSFKPKLGQRESEKSYAVDYSALFQSASKSNSEKTPKAADDQTKRGATAHSTAIPLPIKAKDLKEFVKIPFRCEFSREEAHILRENFLQDRGAELYLGFEILDAIYKDQGRLKTYRFPLYYMKAKVEEAGRVLLVTPNPEADIYLNHLALATLVESFSPEDNQQSDPLTPFFNTLLNQKIEIQGRFSEFVIHRQLPLGDAVFDRVRDMLLGLPGENGKGGLLGHLKIAGIECDLELVVLYKAATAPSPVTRALEIDIDRIHRVAQEQPRRFHQSLLGRFLVPEIQKETRIEAFSQRALCPGALPKSTRLLLEKLNQNDLVLLEGPPGTGKTFTIMNLLIHCVNTRQRLLIVSDQKAAIHALHEKMQEYLLGSDSTSPLSKANLSLYQKAIKMIDALPDGHATLTKWIPQLIQSLNLDRGPEPQPEKEEQQYLEAIARIDEDMKSVIQSMQKSMDRDIGDPQRRWIASKHFHPTTQDDIQDFIAFLDFAGSGRHEKKMPPQSYQRHRDLIRHFILDRDRLREPPFTNCYKDFALADDQEEDREDRITQLSDLLKQLLSQKPRHDSHFRRLIAVYPPFNTLQCLVQTWEECFPPEEHRLLRHLRSWRFAWKHPLEPLWQELQQFLNRQIEVLQATKKLQSGEAIRRQLQGIHEAFDPSSKGHPTLALEAALFSHLDSMDPGSSIQERLLRLQELQTERDVLVKDLFLRQMQETLLRAHATDTKNPTSAWTSVENILESLKNAPSIEHGTGASLLRDLQTNLVSCFPIWICRKQAVSFLFPTQEQLFDLVVIDEAGQCRVDDALPLLFRAKKLMVVGDEKQTVLDKNSALDDFLFKAFSLDDHLKQTQARGMKGGGSHIFGLVKSIKQAEVMLDEHFRCPPDIIQFSNQYVYESNLKIMQWRHRNMPSSVVVDYSEKSSTSNKKASRGKFKDIETELIDRYLDWVASTLRKIEKELGRPINIETEVALCYFLLKNEPYIKDKKAEFLAKLGRGSDILDGAGAALQGKERNFIFYLWDINKGNLRAFRQGDDPDKRKGELNVLMSRPKVRAYHYLHPEFDTLKHDTASITDYLWKTFLSQGKKNAPSVQAPRRIRPGQQFRPWQRSSGELMRLILLQVLRSRKVDRWDQPLESAEISICVGDPKHKIDLLLLTPKRGGRSLALVDLSAFEYDRGSAREVADYFFQLKRAHPPLEPIFVYLHELADERSQIFQYLLNQMERIYPKSS